MKARNLTGSPTPSEYVLGRGKLLVAARDGVTGKPKGGWRDLGNFPSITISFETEKTQHKSSRSGLSVTDTELVFGSTLTATATLENITMENAAFYFGGEVTHDVAQGGTLNVGNPADGDDAVGLVFASYALDGDKDPGALWWPLFSVDRTNSTPVSSRLMGMESSNDWKVYWQSGSNTPGTDHVVDITTYCTFDLKAGMVFVSKDWKDVAGAQTWTTNGQLVLTTNGSARTYNKPSVMKLFTSTGTSWAVKFVGNNPQNGDEAYTYEFHSVKFSPNGEFSLITDQEFGTLPLTMSIERAEAVETASPYGNSLAPYPSS